MKGTLWSRFNKIVKDSSNKIVSCTSSPCVYYIILAIRYRDLNESLLPTSCSWSYMVVPYKVLNDQVDISNIMWYDLKIPVKRGTRQNWIL